MVKARPVMPSFYSVVNVMYKSQKNKTTEASRTNVLPLHAGPASVPAVATMACLAKAACRNASSVVDNCVFEPPRFVGSLAARHEGRRGNCCEERRRNNDLICAG